MKKYSIFIGYNNTTSVHVTEIQQAINLDPGKNCSFSFFFSFLFFSFLLFFFFFKRFFNTILYEYTACAGKFFFTDLPLYYNFSRTAFLVFFLAAQLRTSPNWAEGTHMTACSTLQDLTESVLTSHSLYEENSAPPYLAFFTTTSISLLSGDWVYFWTIFFTFTFVRQDRIKAMIQSKCPSITFDYTIIFVQNPPSPFGQPNAFC